MLSCFKGQPGKHHLEDADVLLFIYWSTRGWKDNGSYTEYLAHLLFLLPLAATLT